MGVANFTNPPEHTSEYPAGKVDTPDDLAQETKDPIKELEKPNPIGADQTPEVVPKKEELLPPPDDILAHQHFVIDTMHNMTGINTDRCPQVVDDLKGYAEGSPKKVTYYKIIQAETDTHGIANDVDIQAHRVHQSLLKIHGFEIRLTGSLQYEHDTAEANNKLSGEALLYPGSNPSKGDIFIMEVESGKFAEMEVNEIPTRMSIKSSTYFKIVFQQTRWMSVEREKALDNCVMTEAYFDKKRYLNESGALLYHAEYVDMKFFELQSAQMVRYYVNKFLDRQVMFSYMRPDNVYDPYVVDFMLKITNYDEAHQLAAQLYRDAPCIETSIWRAFLSETVSLYSVPTSGIINLRKLGSKTVLANSLLNKYYLAWEPNSLSLAEFFERENGEGEDPDPDVDPKDCHDDATDNLIGDLMLHIHPHYRECVLSCVGCCSACCGGDVVTDDSNGSLAAILEGSAEWRELVRGFLKYRRINVDYLRQCIKDVYKLEPIQQFYKMPILVHLARTSVRYIHKESGIYE